MVRSKVLIQKITTRDGKVIAEAQSIAITSDSNASTTHQTVTVKVSSDGSYSSVSRISSCSSTEG
jgi:hypothetical protein